jgi:DeoR/GlpR family transcriptional regulator of sugar metabolism
MSTIDRRDQLLSQLKDNGYIDINTLVKKFSVSESTIRRDLEYLASRGAIMRTHGGAFFSSDQSTTREPSIEQKRRMMTREKKLIGQAAAKLVSRGETVLLDSGSTTWEVGDALRTKSPLTVVSNDLHILDHLGNFEDFTIVDTGGLLKRGLNILLGPTTVHCIEDLHVNWTFLGVDAIDVRKGVTTTNLEESAVKQAMIKAGNQVVLVADHTKFDKKVFAYVCSLTDVSLLITDSGISPEIVNEIHALGVRLEIVSEMIPSN